MYGLIDGSWRTRGWSELGNSGLLPFLLAPSIFLMAGCKRTSNFDEAIVLAPLSFRFFIKQYQATSPRRLHIAQARVSTGVFPRADNLLTPLLHLYCLEELAFCLIRRLRLPPFRGESAKPSRTTQDIE